MPELPEVEVVKRSLQTKLLNLVINKVKIIDSSLRYKINKYQILKLTGSKIKKIERRSKYLIFWTDNDLIILAHLGMTGKFFFIDKSKKKFKTSFYYSLQESKDKKYNKIVFFLQNNQKLIYNDVRKFGFIKVYDKKNYDKISHLKKLGPEPLEKSYNFQYLKNYIVRRKRTIKEILMDQKCVSGLGNIYVNEILFSSGIDPSRKVEKIKDFELNQIIKNTKKILKNSIKLGGSSIKDFSSDDGKKGIFQQHFKVYGKNNELCSNSDCNKRVIKIIISNRSTFFCKKCQK
tara:strand:- start:230 stop:1099 length:870 start_codon:yes stop_codon:yes gene_type:complete